MATNGEMNTSCLKKRAWSHEEDHMLISYINKYGIWNWSQMPKFIGLSRSGKSCRLRWMNYLKPNLKKGSFSKEEEDIILHSHSILGNRWSEIASKLPGRTDNQIKNRWHTHLKIRVTNHYNMTSKTTAHNDNNVRMIQHSTNHVNATSETSDVDTFLSCSTTISNGQEVACQDDYYNIGSPGTVDELQCFWQQLYYEKMDHGNNHMNMY